MSRLEAFQSNLDLEARRAQREILLLREEIGRAKVRIEKLSREKEALVARLEPLLRTVQNLREDVKAAGERVKAEKARLAELEGEKKKVAAALAGVQKELKDLEARKKRMQVRLPALRKEVARLEKEGTPEFQALWKKRQDLLAAAARLALRLEAQVRTYEAARKIFEDALARARALEKKGRKGKASSRGAGASSRPATKPAARKKSRPSRPASRVSGKGKTRGREGGKGKGKSPP